MSDVKKQKTLINVLLFSICAYAESMARREIFTWDLVCYKH